MTLELNLEFITENQVIVHFKAQRSEPLAFKCPNQSPIGENLFKAIFSNRKALHFFRQFQKQEKHDRLLIINSPHSAILSLPWELLYDPETTYLCHDISIRRSLKRVQKPLIFSANKGNLPPLQTDFFGRSQELWAIEKALLQDGARNLSISGIGGQGKTYLAIEAGRWLYRTGLFQKICFVDYATFFGVDAVGLALKTLAKVLDKDLKNVAAANAALHDTPTLLILDNIEIIPPTPLQELLEVAKQWSEIGTCRVLLTSRAVEHNNLIQQSLPLSGLAEEDALAYFKRLLNLHPAQQVERNDLLKLFKQVAFLSLSISVLAIRLKTHRPTELETSLAQIPTNQKPLWAALMVSLEHFTLEIEQPGFLAKILPPKKIRLNTETLHLLPLLGIFQKGAFEPDLLALTKFQNKQWQALRSALETAGLIQLELLPKFKVPYIKFHPCLAPMLWTYLSPKHQNQIFSNYQLRYAQLAGYMFYEEGENMETVHALVWQDLPNLFHAVHGALDAGKLGADKFAKNIDFFLKMFGLKRDSVALDQRVKNTGAEGSYQA